MDNPPSFIILYVLLFYISEFHDRVLMKKTGCLQPITRERKAGTQGTVLCIWQLRTQGAHESPVLISSTKGI